MFISKATSANAKLIYSEDINYVIDNKLNDFDIVFPPICFLLRLICCTKLSEMCCVIIRCNGINAFQ